MYFSGSLLSLVILLPGVSWAQSGNYSDKVTPPLEKYSPGNCTMKLEHHKARAWEGLHQTQFSFFDSKNMPFRRDWEMEASFPINVDLSMDLPNMVPGGDAKKLFRVHYYGDKHDFVFEYGNQTWMSRYPACQVGEYNVGSTRAMRCKFLC
ncbi:hypothetical protein MMC14_000880 [Varicellaria rhodocarpa]|nr:hypothetical protein [Varicellaria rhodocarpa]